MQVRGGCSCVVAACCNQTSASSSGRSNAGQAARGGTHPLARPHDLGGVSLQPQQPHRHVAAGRVDYGFELELHWIGSLQSGGADGWPVTIVLSAPTYQPHPPEPTPSTTNQSRPTPSTTNQPRPTPSTTNQPLLAPPPQRGAKHRGVALDVEPKPAVGVLVVEEVAPHLGLVGRGEDLGGVLDRFCVCVRVRVCGCQ